MTRRTRRARRPVKFDVRPWLPAKRDIVVLVLGGMLAVAGQLSLDHWKAPDHGSLHVTIDGRETAATGATICWLEGENRWESRREAGDTGVCSWSRVPAGSHRVEVYTRNELLLPVDANHSDGLYGSTEFWGAQDVKAPGNWDFVRSTPFIAGGGWAGTQSLPVLRVAVYNPAAYATVRAVCVWGPGSVPYYDGWVASEPRQAPPGVHVEAYCNVPASARSAPFVAAIVQVLEGNWTTTDASPLVRDSFGV